MTKKKQNVPNQEDKKYEEFIESWKKRLDEITDDFLIRFEKMEKTYRYYLIIVYILGFAFGFLTKYLMQ